MKRDMELIRLSLLEVEGEEPKPDLSAYTEEQKVYHVAQGSAIAWAVFHPKNDPCYGLMRILSPRSVCTTTSNFRWCEWPSTISGLRFAFRRPRGTGFGNARTQQPKVHHI